MTAEFFVPGHLVNPLNGSLSRAHWTRKSDWAHEWKVRTWNALHDHGQPEWFAEPEAPKAVHFLAHVGRLWDSDSIPAALKPVRDALMGRQIGQLVPYRVIHSDAPDSGHVFTYEQVVDRKRRGVLIRIERLCP